MERDVEHHKIIVVDGYEYLVQHPQVEEGFEIGMELLKMVGGPIAAMTAGARSEADASSALQAAVTGLLKNADTKQLMFMIKRMLKYVELQGKVDGDRSKLLLDEKGIQKHFRGGLGSMLKLTGEVAAFTHRDFFLSVGDGVKDLMQMIAEKE